MSSHMIDGRIIDNMIIQIRLDFVRNTNKLIQLYRFLSYLEIIHLSKTSVYIRTNCFKRRIYITFNSINNLITDQ